jgi:hypothetical protein
VSFKDVFQLLCLVGSIVSVAQPVSAEVPPSDATEHLAVLISGHITPSCAVAATGATALSFGQILDGRNGAAAPAALDLPFSFHCNTGYTASLISRHGGLAFEGNPATGFSSLVGYSATIGLEKGNGNFALSCDSPDMFNSAAAGGAFTTNCKGSSDGLDYSAGNGVVKLKIKSGGLPLLHGNYSDELTLQIAPNVSG